MVAEEDDETRELKNELLRLQTAFESGMQNHKQNNNNFEKSSNDFIELFNKIKANMQRDGCTSELLDECQTYIKSFQEDKKTYHPVFINLAEEQKHI